MPYDLARSYTKDDLWTPDEYRLAPGIRSSILVNLATEDNLPYYANTILNFAPADHPFRDWSRQWIAEEARHSIVIRDWVIATRAIDPTLLENYRIAQMRTGKVPEPPTFAELLAYTALQELATQVAHRNTGKLLDKDKGGSRVMATVAGDEGLHHEFYRELAARAISIDPSLMVVAIWKQLRHFKMPGTGIPNFIEHAKAIEGAGIYDQSQYLRLVVDPTLKKWGIGNLGNLSEEAELARDKIYKHVSLLGRVAVRRADLLLTNSA